MALLYCFACGGGERMTSNLKKKKERDLLLEFKALYSEFPRGEITDSEPPDFLIATDNGIIGIELEDYIRGYRLGKGSGGSPIRQSESNQAEFLQATQNIYEAKQLEPLIVDFSCSGYNLIKRSDIKILAEYTVRLIEMAL